jgi:glycosyltransferase involved in cell wall biosynthesis
MRRLERQALLQSPGVATSVLQEEATQEDGRILDVVFFRHSLFNRGGDRIVVQYANYLAERGHQVTFVVNNVATSFKIHHRVYLKKIPLPTKLGTMICGVIGRFGGDVVLIDIVPLALLLRPFHPVIYLAQAYDVLYYRHPMLRRLVAWMYTRFFRASCSPVIADSEFLASIFREQYRASDMTVVEIGIDHDRFFPEPDQRLMVKKSGRKAIVMLARSDGYRKGGDVCQKVLRRLCRTGSDQYELWVIGSSEVSLPPGFGVTRFKRPSDNELRTILSSADVLFYPSRHEGFGLFPLEAMACGCPVVTTTAVSYVTDGDNAYAASPDETEGLEARLIRALVDKTETASMRERALGFSRRYDIKKSQVEFERTLCRWAKRAAERVSHRR